MRDSSDAIKIAERRQSFRVSATICHYSNFVLLLTWKLLQIALQ